VDAIAKKAGSRVSRSRPSSARANNAPQNMRARKTEAMILEMMPARTWMTCTSVSRLIRAADDRKTRSRLDRLARDGKIKCKAEQSSRGLVYMFCKLP
jgi:hypothetical protein